MQIKTKPIEINQEIQSSLFIRREKGLKCQNKNKKDE